MLTLELCDTNSEKFNRNGQARSLQVDVARPPGIWTPACAPGPAFPFRPASCRLSHQPTPLLLPLVMITFCCSQPENVAQKRPRKGVLGLRKQLGGPSVEQGRLAGVRPGLRLSRGMRERDEKEPAGFPSVLGAWGIGGPQFLEVAGCILSA